MVFTRGWQFTFAHLMADIASWLQYSFHPVQMKPQDPSPSRRLIPNDLGWNLFVISNLEHSPPNLVAPSPSNIASASYVILSTFNLSEIHFPHPWNEDHIITSHWVCNKIMHIKTLCKHIECLLLSLNYSMVCFIPLVLLVPIISSFPLQNSLACLTHSGVSPGIVPAHNWFSINLSPPLPIPNSPLGILLIHQLLVFTDVIEHNISKKDFKTIFWLVSLTIHPQVLQ